MQYYAGVSRTSATLELDDPPLYYKNLRYLPDGDLSNDGVFADPHCTQPGLSLSTNDQEVLQRTNRGGMVLSIAGSLQQSTLFLVLPEELYV